MLHDESTDEAFLAAFEACTLSAGAFTHREHVRLAWLLARTLPPAGMRRRLETGIRAFAARHGAAHKYHATITEAWARLVEDALRRSDPATVTGSFDIWIAAWPDLLDPRRLAAHYSADRLGSPEARARWIEPDLRPLPGSRPGPETGLVAALAATRRSLSASRTGGDGRSRLR